MTIDATTRILLEKYDPTNEALQAPVSASSDESLHAHKQTNKASPASFQEAIYKSASGRTGLITVVLDSTKYDDAIITKACAEFNKAYPAEMSNSFQIPCTYEGIPAGSWVFIEYPEETNGSNK
jgi:hypothetical protein